MSPSTKYRPLEIANTFIRDHGHDGNITHMKVQKLTHLVHGFWLQSHDEPVLRSDPEVWTYGPVFSNLFRELRDYKNTPITEPVQGDFDDEPPLVENKEVELLINQVWNKYGDKSGTQLSDLTHKPGTPWFELAKRYDFRVPKGLTIPFEMVRDHYREDIPILG